MQDVKHSPDVGPRLKISDFGMDLWALGYLLLEGELPLMDEFLFFRKARVGQEKRVTEGLQVL